MSDAGLADPAKDLASGTTSDPKLRSVPIDRISANAHQPRQTFAEDELEELAASIRAKGVLQPLIVRTDPTGPDRFQIVAGERRWRAAQMAGLHEVPVVLREFEDAELLEVAIIENIQRADLNPIEEAEAYKGLIDRHGHTQEQLATVLGRSRSHVANVLRLVNLPEEIIAMVRSGDLTSGHARALLTAEQPVDLAREIVARNLSVRETERLAKRRSGTPPSSPTKRRRSVVDEEKDPDTRMLEGDLSATLRMAVTIRHSGAGDGGVLSVRYRDLDQLDALCELLANGLER
jgi:ParB family chromosome partitioning protein